MRTAYTLLLGCLLTALTVNARAEAAPKTFTYKIWPTLTFSEVRAYVWPTNLEPRHLITSKFEFSDGVTDKKGTTLPPAQVEALEAATTGKHPNHPVAACYSPHNLFVFYDTKHKPAAYVEICFSCMGYRTYPEGAAETLDLIGLATIFDSLKLPLGADKDLDAFKEGKPFLFKPDVENNRN